MNNTGGLLGKTRQRLIFQTLGRVQEVITEEAAGGSGGPRRVIYEEPSQRERLYKFLESDVVLSAALPALTPANKQTIIYIEDPAILLLLEEASADL